MTFCSHLLITKERAVQVTHQPMLRKIILPLSVFYLDQILQSASSDTQLSMVRQLRSSWRFGSTPSPAAERSTFSYSGQSRRGRMNVL